MLQLLNIVKNRTAIRLTWAASVLATVWMCGAGMFYMVCAYCTVGAYIVYCMDARYNADVLSLVHTCDYNRQSHFGDYSRRKWRLVAIVDRVLTITYHSVTIHYTTL